MKALTIAYHCKRRKESQVARLLFTWSLVTYRTTEKVYGLRGSNMKKILVLMLLCWLLALPVAAQKKSDRETAGLKGLVNSIRAESTSYKQQAGEWVTERIEIASTEYGPDGRTLQHAVRSLGGSLLYRYSYAYNDAGKLVEVKHYGMGDNQSTPTRYEYDSQGELIAETEDGVDGAVYSSTTHKYDDRGREIENVYKSRSDSFKMVNRYDEQGRLLETINYQSDELFKKREYAYNDNGKLNKSVLYRLVQQRPEIEEVRNYDASGNVLERIHYAANGAVDFKEVASYNQDGNAIEKTLYGGDGTLKSKTTTTFEYDSHGNWTKKKTETARADLKPLTREITVRSILYDAGIGPGSQPSDKPAAFVGTKPVPLNQPVPDYTDAAKRNGVEGTVRLRVLIGPDGLVKQARLIRGLPDGLNEEALRAAFKLKFKPAMVNGQPVNFWAPVDVEFRLKR